MRVTFWGTRGSLASPGPETARYGGNTSCVEVRADDGTVLALDAGTGIRRMGTALPADLARVDILLTHLHMDHIQGLGFFAPLHKPGVDVHIWGPRSTKLDLQARLVRYLSPPLFPIHLREVACNLTLHEVAGGRFEIGPFTVSAALVCHPGATLGFRIEADGAAMTYLPDHELALGGMDLGGDPSWISGFDLAYRTDLLVHDAQFTPESYAGHEGWGHSAFDEVVRFADRVGADHLVLFHHNPDHDDKMVDAMQAGAAAMREGGARVSAAAEGQSIDLRRVTEL